MACTNTIEYSCTYSCARHGKCCECIVYHNRAGELPACVFSAEAERTYNRSLDALIRDRKR